MPVGNPAGYASNDFLGALLKSQLGGAAKLLPQEGDTRLASLLKGLGAGVGSMGFSYSSPNFSITGGDPSLPTKMALAKLLGMGGNGMGGGAVNSSPTTPTIMAKRPKPGVRTYAPLRFMGMPVID